MIDKYEKKKLRWNPGIVVGKHSRILIKSLVYSISMYANRKNNIYDLEDKQKIKICSVIK